MQSTIRGWKISINLRSKRESSNCPLMQISIANIEVQSGSKRNLKVSFSFNNSNSTSKFRCLRCIYPLVKYTSATVKMPADNCSASILPNPDNSLQLIHGGMMTTLPKIALLYGHKHVSFRGLKIVSDFSWHVSTFSIFTWNGLSYFHDIKESLRHFLHKFQWNLTKYWQVSVDTVSELLFFNNVMCAPETRLEICSSSSLDEDWYPHKEKVEKKS